MTQVSTAMLRGTAGRRAFERLGIDVAALEATRSPTCLECLDWSERRSRLAGGLGRALFAHLESRGWIRRRLDSRALDLTPSGRRAIGRHFG